jgi:DNA helicase HerA-like ATPase
MRAANQVGLNGCEDLIRDGYITRYSAATGQTIYPEEFLRLKGNDLLKIPGAIPTLEQVVASGKKNVWEKIQKSGSNRDRERASYFEDMLNAVAGTRIRYLFTGDNSVASLLFDENAAVDLDQLGDDDLKRGVIRSILLKLREHRIAQRAAGIRPCHFTLLDEAHNVLPAAAQNHGNSEIISGAQELSEQMAKNLMELRGYGESFVLASQSPSELSPTVLRTAGVLVCMGIQEGTDRERVQRAMGLSDSQTGALSSLDKGEAIVSIQGRPPYHTKIPLMPMFRTKD